MIAGRLKAGQISVLRGPGGTDGRTDGWMDGQTGGQTDGRTNESPPVFFRTSSPLGIAE